MVLSDSMTTFNFISKMWGVSRADASAKMRLRPHPLLDYEAEVCLGDMLEWTVNILKFPYGPMSLSVSRKGQCWSVNICFHRGLSFWPARLSTMIVRQVSGTADTKNLLQRAPTSCCTVSNSIALVASAILRRCLWFCLLEYYSWLMQRATLD